MLTYVMIMSSDFMKLNLLPPADAAPDAPGQTFFVRATDIAAMCDDEGNKGTIVFTQGVDKAFRVTQSPDEILAMMKDDSSSLPMRHILERQAMIVDPNKAA